uniref:Uncharacterized protein n=1 Tax=Knipowitschia caucasica TaxID=637954 RepID=A0AAV2M7F5_KNICA
MDENGVRGGEAGARSILHLHRGLQSLCVYVKPDRKKNAKTQPGPLLLSPQRCPHHVCGGALRFTHFVVSVD